MHMIGHNCWIDLPMRVLLEYMKTKPKDEPINRYMYGEIVLAGLFFITYLF